MTRRSEFFVKSRRIPRPAPAGTKRPDAVCNHLAGPWLKPLQEGSNPMSNTTAEDEEDTSRETATQRHAFAIGIGATLLTGAVIWFNGKYGYDQGGVAMAAAFVGFAILKDGAFSYAWAARGEYGRVAAAVLGVIAFGISCLAAVGAASSGKQEASDPKAQAIERYNSAQRQQKKAEKRLAEIGQVPNASEARAMAERELATVDPSIAKRTASCSVLDPKGSGTRQIAVNRQACQPYADALATIGKSEEAEKLRAKLDAAETVLAEGKPATADSQASTIAAVLGLFINVNGISGIQAWTVLFVGLGLEICSPFAWATFASARRGRSARPSFSKVSDEARKINMPTFSDPEATFSEVKEAALANVDTSALAAMFSGDQPDPTPPRGGRKTKKPSVTATLLQFPAKHPVEVALERNGGSVASNHELAGLMGVSDGEASKRWPEIEHKLDVTREGKRVRIALKAAIAG